MMSLTRGWARASWALSRPAMGRAAVAQVRAASYAPLPKSDRPRGYLGEDAGVPIARDEGPNAKFVVFPTLEHMYKISLPELLSELNGTDVVKRIHQARSEISDLMKQPQLGPEDKKRLELLRRLQSDFKHIQTEADFKAYMLNPNEKFEEGLLEDEASKEQASDFEHRMRLLLYDLFAAGAEAHRASTKDADAARLMERLRQTAAQENQPSQRDLRKPLPTDRYDSHAEVLEAFLHANLPQESIGHSWSVQQQQQYREPLHHWNDIVHLPYGHTAVRMKGWNRDQSRAVMINFHYRTMAIVCNSRFAGQFETNLRIPGDWLLAFKKQKWPGSQLAMEMYGEPRDEFGDEYEDMEELFTDVRPIRCDRSAKAGRIPFPVRRNNPIAQSVNTYG